MSADAKFWAVEIAVCAVIVLGMWTIATAPNTTEWIPADNSGECYLKVETESQFPGGLVKKTITEFCKEK